MSDELPKLTIEILDEAIYLNTRGWISFVIKNCGRDRALNDLNDKIKHLLKARAELFPEWSEP